MCILFVCTLLKVVSYYDFTVLSMSVMGIQKKFGWGMGGWGELYPVLFWIFGICFNIAKPLSVAGTHDSHSCPWVRVVELCPPSLAARLNRGCVARSECSHPRQYWH